MDGGGTGLGVLEPPAARTDLAVGADREVPVGPDAGIMAVLATTRAMRHLAPDPVPDDLLRSIVEAATWAPSGGNWQVARYVIVSDRVTMERIAVLWRRVTEDWWLLLDAAGISPTGASAAKTRASIDYQRDHFAETPALIVVCGDPAPVDRKRGSAAALRYLIRRVGVRRAIGLARGFRRMSARTEGGSIYPAVENLLLAARAHGLAACLTTWHLLAEDEFKQILGIPGDVKTWAVIPVGWPLRSFGPVRRRPVDEVIRRDRW